MKTAEHHANFLQRVASGAQTLKFRLMLLITLALLVVIGGPLGFLVYQLDKSGREFRQNLVEMSTQAVYHSIFPVAAAHDREAIQQSLALFAMNPSINLVRVYLPSGKIVYSSHASEINQNIFESIDRQALAPLSSREQETFRQSEEGLTHYHPVYRQADCLPCHSEAGEVLAVLDVRVDGAGASNIYASIKRYAILSGALIIVLLWVVLNLLYRSQIEVRLQKVLDGFAELARGNFSHRVNIPGRHELARLAQRFNQTVEQLKVARQCEEQLLEEKLQRADRLVTLGEVAAEIAHEVNNPAGIILTRAEFLRDEMEENFVTTTYVEDVDMIIRQTERIASTTRSILQFARKLPQEFVEVDLREAVEQSLQLMEPRLRKQDVKVQVIWPEAPCRVRGDMQQLQQVFCNLITNSLDVLEPGRGEITIRTAWHSANGRPGRFVITFQDNGPGVPAELRSEIFAPFFTTKANGKGTGLGLFIVRKILAYHGGTIELSGQQQHGATFVIELEASHG